MPGSLTFLEASECQTCKPGHAVDRSELLGFPEELRAVGTNPAVGVSLG